MLGLQVASPGYFVIKFVVVFLQQFDCFGISHMTKLRVYHMLQSLDQAFVHKGIEECHLLRAMLHCITDHVFQHTLCQDHVILQVCE